MSLAALINSIEAEAQASADAIRARAEAQAAQLLAAADADTARLYGEAQRAAAQAGLGELAGRINQASFASLCLVGEARDVLVEQALAAASERLAGARQDPTYPALLARLLVELLPPHHNAHGPADGLIIEADPLDRPLLERILAEQHLPATVDYCLDCWGGLNARSLDGRTRTHNTLEARLAQASPYLKQTLAAWFAAAAPGV